MKTAALGGRPHDARTRRLLRRAGRAAGGSRCAAGCRRACSARHFTRAAHLDLDAAVGLQAGDELRAPHALALVAGDRLVIAAALGAHAVLFAAELREVLPYRFRALGRGLLVVLLVADAVGVADRQDRLHLRILDALGELVELLLPLGLQLRLV